MRICTTCGEDKEYSSYTKDKTKPDGLYTICKDCLKKKRNKIKQEKSKYDKQYRIENRELLIAKGSARQKAIPNIIRAERNRKYRQKHREKYNESQLQYIKENKYRFAYRTVLRNFLVRCKTEKINTTSLTLGYDYNKFKERIEFQFKEGMTWNNHGKWHVDHKKPVSKFNEGTPANIVNALCNLQPLWADENLSKGNNFILKNTHNATPC